MIGTILLVAITVVLVAIAGAMVLGFGDAVSGGKIIGVVPHTTGDDAKPLQLTFWGEDLVKMKGVQVAVATAEGVRIGSPVDNKTVFSDGVPVLIEFDESFAEGEYPMAITATFDDKTEQVIYTGKIRIGAIGKYLPEAKNRATPVIVIDNYKTIKDTKIAELRAIVLETEKNEPYKIIEYRWDFGDGNSSRNSVNNTIHQYAKKAGNYTVTLEIVYDDMTKNTANTTIIFEDGDSIETYLSDFKFTHPTGYHSTKLFHSSIVEMDHRLIQNDTVTLSIYLKTDQQMIDSKNGDKIGNVLSWDIIIEKSDSAGGNNRYTNTTVKPKGENNYQYKWSEIFNVGSNTWDPKKVEPGNSYTITLTLNLKDEPQLTREVKVIVY
ncbi:PKD domain-containing protein [Methanorbis rubei]|uniref:PKD domain-containing protein n=1 Tax=Methanorbis rubei TaxID=3028300 RepID=UPI0030B9175B